jgi:hypothetical protein
MQFPTISTVAPRVMPVAMHPSRSAILFRTPDGAGTLRHRGIDVDDDLIMFLGSSNASPGCLTVWEGRGIALPL